MTSDVHPLVLRGRQAFQSGDLAAALSLGDMRLREDPADLAALQLKSKVQQRRGDERGAEATLRRAIAVDPACGWPRLDLTEMLHRLGDQLAAETVAREALAVLPDDPQAHAQFAVILGEKDDLPAAEFHNRRALDLAGPHPQILVNLGLCLYNQGRIDEAEPLLLQAHRLTPDVAMTMAHLSRIYEARRDMANAYLWLDRAETAGRRTGEDFTLLRALYLANAGKPQAALDLIDATGARLGAPAQLDRARLLDKLGRPDEAWPAFFAAKAALGKEMGVAYDAPRVAQEFAALKGFFTTDTLARLPRASRRNDVAQPIFILGFPRSGTTLIEQMLDSHPDVAAGGELPFVHEWPKLINDLLPGSQPFPLKLAQACAADYHHIAGVLRDYYLGRVETYGLLRDGKPFFTDKMPLHDVYLPLIRLAFPEAAILRMVRHPLDVLLSMLSHNLTHGYGCGYAVDTILTHMQAMQALNRHYDEVLGHPALVVRYETFVAQQEAETHRMLDHAGLSFDPACLHFHENRRHAPTPSYAQVTQPLNDRSIGRWRDYEKHLQSYMPVIAPVISELGYA